ncbi:MAG TPA: response regulator transcription factor [Oceanipulchritudo sp.]|nr:response regulator transcription factor [Oceanipulchritudo sp.]
MAESLFLIEDEALVCELLTEFLEDVEAINFLGDARDGATAIERCRELKPDIIILDLRLPEMSGLEVLKILHKEQPELKVIIFTGSLSEETLQITLANGAIAYVEKAYGLEELQKAIAAALKGERYFSPSIKRLIEDYEF